MDADPDPQRLGQFVPELVVELSEARQHFAGAGQRTGRAGRRR